MNTPDGRILDGQVAQQVIDYAAGFLERENAAIDKEMMRLHRANELTEARAFALCQRRIGIMLFVADLNAKVSRGEMASAIAAKQDDAAR